MSIQVEGQVEVLLEDDEVVPLMEELSAITVVEWATMPCHVEARMLPKVTTRETNTRNSRYECWCSKGTNNS